MLLPYNPAADGASLGATRSYLLYVQLLAQLLYVHLLAQYIMVPSTSVWRCSLCSLGASSQARISMYTYLNEQPLKGLSRKTLKPESQDSHSSQGGFD
jgi:hypothetical protein